MNRCLKCLVSKIPHEYKHSPTIMMVRQMEGYSARIEELLKQGTAAVNDMHVCHPFPAPANMHALNCPTGAHPGGWQHMPGPHHHCTMGGCGPWRTGAVGNGG